MYPSQPKKKELDARTSSLNKTLYFDYILIIKKCKFFYNFVILSVKIRVEFPALDGRVYIFVVPCTRVNAREKIIW